MYKLDFNIISLIIKTILRSKIGKYYDPNFYKHSKKYTLDQIITDLILFLKRGTSWRDHCGTVCWNTLFMHYQRFTKENIFKKCYDIIINKYSTQNKSQCIIVDSSFIGNKNGKNKIGRNKYFKNKNCNKLSILCDENGFPFSIIIKEGNINDAKLFISHKRHLHRINKNKTQKYVLADAGYDSSKVKKIETLLDGIIVDCDSFGRYQGYEGLGNIKGQINNLRKIFKTEYLDSFSKIGRAHV